MSKPSHTYRRFPAEWEPHRATWIAWPHEPTDWPGKFPVIDWVYVEIVRHLSTSELVEIVCHDRDIAERARHCLHSAGVRENYRLHHKPNNRGWLRDSAPTLVRSNGGTEWIKWSFNAWAKYDNYDADRAIPDFIGQVSGIPVTSAYRADGKTPLVLEGGAIDTDGLGTLLTTEECLLSEVQQRNPGLDRSDYEQLFKEYLGITSTIWLAGSCEGDDTHGHIDDAARFVAPGKVVLAYEEDPLDPNHAMSKENLQRLKMARDAQGRPLEIIKLPMPHRLMFNDYRLPASYANFYIGNKIVLCPTFNDSKDSEALATLRQLFPGRSVIGIHSVDLVLGFGTLHCLSQQEPS